MAELRADDAVIVAGLRSPIGRAVKGSLASVRPEDVALSTVRAVLAQVPQLDLSELEDFYLGCANPEAEHGQNLARRIAVMAGLDALPGATVNRFCASSLQAARMAFHGVRSGEGDAFLVGGVECVSRYPMIDEAPHPAFEGPAATATETFEDRRPWTDPRRRGALPDVYVAMGRTAEFVAQTTGTGRQEQDAFAARSQQRAGEAVAAGFFAAEIAPFELPSGEVVTADDGPRPGTTTQILAGLKPAFHPEGSVTAGNSSPLNDGASAAVIMRAGRAAELGIAPQARIVSSAVSALSPETMGMGPVEATRTALRRAQLSIQDIDVVELNEAFAAQAVPSAREIGVSEDRLNPHGGAIALGHPFGSTGVRLLITLINGLRHRDGELGLATLCVGGGQGMAMVVERL